MGHGTLKQIPDQEMAGRIPPPSRPRVFYRVRLQILVVYLWVLASSSLSGRVGFKRLDSLSTYKTLRIRPICSGMSNVRKFKLPT